MRAVYLVFISALALCVCATRTIMPWMCLERCGEDVESSVQQLIKLGPKVVPRVSIEAYDLEHGGSIVDCGYSKVGPRLHNAGIAVEPMITTASIGKMRELFQYMDCFISQAVAEAKNQKSWMVGYNVDFEPEYDANDPPTEEDARKYAAFLDKFAKALHAEGFTLSVAVAGFLEIWDHDLLAKTAVDRFITMDTYAVGYDDYEVLVQRYYNHYGTKLGIGLDTWAGFGYDAIKARFDLVKQYSGITAIGIWATPIPSGWVDLMYDYVNN